MSSLKPRYVALVRGINVGGNSIIKMAELRKLFESARLTDVETYIQSGNVLFYSPNADTSQLVRQLEQKLAPAMGSRVKVFVLTQDDLRQTVAHNPFHPEKREKEIKCHLMFLSAEPDAAHREALLDLQGEEYQFAFYDKVLYYAYPSQFAGNRRTIDFEKVLRVTGTSRSWKVVNKLIDLSD